MNAVLLVLLALLSQTPIERPAIPECRTDIAGSAEKPAPPVLVETDPKRVAYIEHSGPYWSLGPVIDQVARDARDMGVRDALVIRYLDDTVASSPRGLRAHIGFELAGTEMPRPPYQVAEWPRVLVARKTVNGPDGLSTRHFASLKAWAQTQGLAPAGDLIALVKFGEGGESAAIEHAEIRLPVCVPDPLPAAVSKSDSIEAPNRADVLESERSPAAQRRVSKIVQLPVPADVTNEKAAPLDAIASDALPPAMRARMQSTDGRTPNPAAVTRTAAPVRQWIEEEKFAEVAAALLPENADPASQQWADQIAARIVAVANGIKTLAPGEEGWLSPLAAQLSAQRSARKTSTVKGTPRVIGLSAPAAANEPERKAVMRALDYLMARIAQRTLTPAQVRESLLDLIEISHALVLPK